MIVVYEHEPPWSDFVSDQVLSEYPNPGLGLVVLPLNLAKAPLVSYVRRMNYNRISLRSVLKGLTLIIFTGEKARTQKHALN